MNKLSDRLLLHTGFGKMILSRLITKKIREKLGSKSSVVLDDIDAEYSDGVLSIEISKIHVEIDGESLSELLGI